MNTIRGDMQAIENRWHAYGGEIVEEISAMVGFANRQSFYAAFYKNVGETPNGYRKRNQEKK